MNLANEWLDFKKNNALGDKPLSAVLELASKFIKNELEPSIGDREFSSIKRTDFVKLIRNIEGGGIKEPCRKAYSYLNQMYEYAVSIGYVEVNIAPNLNKILIKTRIKQNYAYLDQYKIIKFFQAIDQSNSHPTVKKAI